jgi:hypothetical protein
MALADICAAKFDGRFTPKADKCAFGCNVRYVPPISDIQPANLQSLSRPENVLRPYLASVVSQARPSRIDRTAWSATAGHSRTPANPPANPRYAR